MLPDGPRLHVAIPDITRARWSVNTDRTAALADFLIFYNTVRGHDSLAGTPISRLAA